MSPSDTLSSQPTLQLAPQCKPTQSTGPVRKLHNGMLDPMPCGHYIALVQRNAQRSPLLRLPAEVRNSVFKYALGGQHTFDVTKIRKAPRSARSGQQYWRIPLHLLQVCRQIYHEACLLPFLLNSFMLIRKLPIPTSGLLSGQLAAITTLDLTTASLPILDLPVELWKPLCSLQKVFLNVMTLEKLWWSLERNHDETAAIAAEEEAVRHWASGMATDVEKALGKQVEVEWIPTEIAFLDAKMCARAQDASTVRLCFYCNSDSSLHFPR
ncbi:hypothetical protein CC80DRAFT_540543 [Byssothecium circinans]|uniref:Uncharacterized protein n=1 Tax=Byssothecium circinans TaxID=147558 RepID=A0A6A5T933_9PLEO|nr:hypothetical protein CC80DRAFT_540543 [Byssothecium circinans]